MGKLIQDVDPARREALRLDDFDAYMRDKYQEVFPDLFPLVTTVNRFDELRFERIFADEIFQGWRFHLEAQAWEIRRAEQRTAPRDAVAGSMTDASQGMDVDPA